MLHQVLVQYETNKFNYKSILYKIINIKIWVKLTAVIMTLCDKTLLKYYQ